jgi:phage-related protein
MIYFDSVKFCEEAEEFMDKLDEKSRRKIYFNIRKSKYIKDKELFKPLEDNIWEFRTLYLKKKIRLFAFWDKEDKEKTLVIATHGIIKKRSKVPKKEIEKAKRIRTNYFNSKK